MDKSDKPLLLIDTSYTSFYRFFATLRWYSMANKEDFELIGGDPKYNWIDNKVFMEKYEKMYLDSIAKLVGKKVFKNCNILFCLDTPKMNLWRMELMKSYKGDRADLSKKNNFKPVFEYTYKTMLPKFIKENKHINSLSIDKLEADDLIAGISLHYEKNYPKHQVYVISGDEDFLQLGRPNLTIINYKTKKPIEQTKEEAITALRHKIINGDKSDGISGIISKGTRPKPTRKQMEASQEELDKYVATNGEAKKQYELNLKLIDFNYIPKEYISKIIENFNKLVF